MKAGDELLSAVFNKDHRYVVPIFQRPYVWSEEENWLPLWNDICKVAEEVERQDAAAEDPVAREYFLGAFVTQHRSPVPRRKPTSMVIDGQQRMTTLQVFMAAAWRVAARLGATQAADSFEALVRNRVSRDSEFPEDRLKVTPLDHDSMAFAWAVRRPDDAGLPGGNHRLVQAARWFEGTVEDWVKEAACPEARLDLLHFAVENRIKVVSIYLDATDDPQVIFEALNHRGVRLDAADLVKNLLFQTVDAQGDQALEQELLTDHWSLLDTASWRREVTTGRIKRVRVDTLLAYFLSAQRGEESSVEHLFEDFKHWLRTSGLRAKDVIKAIRVYAGTMERLQALPMTDPVAQVLDRLEATGTTTPWPLILFLHADEAVPAEQTLIGARALDSFLMRRAVCRLGTKDYNRLFGTLLGAIKDGDRSSGGDLLVQGLLSQIADSRVWPDDKAFLGSLLWDNLYEGLVRARLRTLLVGLENHLLTSRSEPATPHKSASKALTIEHVMPVSWREYWPLEHGDEQAANQRDTLVHGLGNLTLATQSLNSTLSNLPWSQKRHTLQTHSLARLTTASVLTCPHGTLGFTQDTWVADWDADRIFRRARYLGLMTLDVWPRQGSDTDPTLLLPTAEPAILLPGGRPPEPPVLQPTIRPSESVVIQPAARPPERAVVSPSVRPPKSPPRRTYMPAAGQRTVHAMRGSLLPLIQAGVITAGDSLRHEMVRSGRAYTATVTSDGGLNTDIGYFTAPSTALTRLLGSSRNGWDHWVHVPTGKPLAALREMLDD